MPAVNPADLRVTRWDLLASAGTTRSLRFVSPDLVLASLSVWTGGDVSDVDDLAGATEHPGVVSGGGSVAMVDLAVPAGGGVPLRLAVNGVVVTVGTLTPSSTGAVSPDTDLTLRLGDAVVSLSVLGVGWAATLTTDDDLLTRAGGVPARLTRADLAADPAFSDTYAPLDSPTFTATEPAGGGFRLFAAERSDGARLIDAVQNGPSPNNAFTTLNIYPTLPAGRNRLSFWWKSPEDLAVDEDNHRPLSIETHGDFDTEEDHHVTFYTYAGASDTTTFGSKKVLQWFWGPDWDNRLEILAVAWARGQFDVGSYDGWKGVYLGIRETDVGQPIILFQGPESGVSDRAFIDYRSGALRLFAKKAGGKVTLDAPNVEFSNGTTRFLPTAPVRAEGVIDGIAGQKGVWIGTTASDVAQPQIKFEIAGDGNQWTIENRLSRLRFISGGTLPLQMEANKVGFFGTLPVAKPAVTGSRGGNAALASIITALASLGLLTDSSTA